MGWKLYEIVDIEQHKKDCEHGTWWKKPNMKAGAWWYERRQFEELKNNPNSSWAKFIKEHCVSKIYMEKVFPQRAPIVICLPNGSHWSPDSKASNGDGWNVTGGPHNWTAMPSIYANQGRKQTPDYLEYHGWLKNGELTDDLSRITYDRLKDDWKE